MRKFLLYLALTACAWASAQEYAPQHDTIMAPPIKETVVSARRDGMAPVQQITAGQLRRAVSYSVADAVRFFAGVQIKDYGGIGGLKTVNVRSMGSEHTAVSYDGVQVTNAQNATVDLGKFSLSNAGSITLSNGGDGIILKPARNFGAASALEISPAKPHFTTKPYNLQLTCTGGSFGTFSPEAVWEQRLGSRTSLRVNAAWLTSNGRYSFRYHLDGGYDTTATRRNGDIDILRGEASLFGNISGGEWRARGYVYSSHRGLPGAVVRNRLSHIDRQNDLNTFAQASLRKSNGRNSILANAKLSYDYLHYIYDARLDQGSMPVNNRYRQIGAYASLADRFAFSEKLQASLAADYAMDGLEADLQNFARPLRHSLFASAAVGAMLGRFSIQGNVMLARIENRARNRAGGALSIHTGLSHGLHASWAPRQLRKLTLRAFGKRSYRVPSLNDLYYTFIGNANLKPEYASQIDIGATWRAAFNGAARGRISLKADVYANRITDKIVAVPTTNQFRWTMTNIGKVMVHGIDAAAECSATAAACTATVRVAYTWQRAMDCTDRNSAYYKGQIAYIPRHSASVAADVEWKSWSANLSWLYTGHRYDSSANIPANYLQAFHTVDLALNRNLRMYSVEANLSLAVNNVLNRHYDVVRCYPMPGRNFKAALTLKI